MYKSKKISVAIASYNGEKFIEKQIESICNQTIVPDEIIVSDDGSKDGTLNIVGHLSEKYRENIEIKLITDNPRHGYCGNFEWAITHTTGDYIFISDQDDYWYPHKIEMIMHIFGQHPEAECIIHESDLIDENGDIIQDVFNRFSYSHLKDKDEGKGYQLNRDQYLSAAVSQPLANGMVLCVTKDSLGTSIPFPKCDGSHDHWIIFCSVLNDKCWYTSAVLEGYRLHGNNSCGNSVYRGPKLAHIKNMLSKLKVNGVRNVLNLLCLGSNMMELISQKGLEDSDAYRVAKRVFEIGDKEFLAVTSGRISGAWQLYQMYKNDIRYRSMGKTSFICQMCRILLYNKSKRCSLL